MKERGITISHIGTEGLDMRTFEYLRNIGELVPNLVLVDDDSVEINGIRYAPIKRESKLRKSEPLDLAMIAATAIYTPYARDYIEIGGYDRKLSPDIDMIKEFELIQHKKSKLSKWERDAVVHIFNRNYQEIKGETK